jgi:hypothetical protein
LINNQPKVMNLKEIDTHLQDGIEMVHWLLV